MLVADLLDYIKAYVYGKSLKFETVDVSELVEGKFNVFKDIIVVNGNSVNKAIPPNLMVYTDYQMISIVFNNLIDNAAKHTHGGTITIQAWEQGTDTHFLISNDGPPIPEEVMVMFNQNLAHPGKSLPAEFKSGLGAFLIREITDLLNVTLTVIQTQTTNFELIFNGSPNLRK